MVSEALGKIQERVVQVKISPSFFPAYEESCVQGLRLGGPSQAVTVRISQRESGNLTRVPKSLML